MSRNLSPRRMSLSLSQDVRYALIMLTELVQFPSHCVSVGKIARHYQLSPKFLELVTGKLRRAGLVKGVRGRSGGYHLNQGTLSVAHVFDALGKQQPSISCLLSDACRGGAQCIEKELESVMVGKMNDELIKLQLTV